MKHLGSCQLFFQYIFQKIIENIESKKLSKLADKVSKGLTLKRYRALLTKNWLQILRDRPCVCHFKKYISFDLKSFLYTLSSGRVGVCILPLVQVLIFLTCIGSDFKGLVVAVVNEEAGNCDSGINVGKTIRFPENKTCDYVNISCTFLNGFDNSIAIKV